MSADNTILNCPFCGGECSPGTVTYSATTARDNGWDREVFHFINCCNCGVSNAGLRGYDTPDEALDHWNRRIA